MSYGLDKHIDTTIQRLTEGLWLGYDTSYLGRSWVIDKKDGNQPFAYEGSNEYKDVLATDLKDGLIHFHVESNRPNSGYSTYTATVYIMVAVNLGKIYGTSIRAVEQAHQEVTEIINNSPFGKCNLVTDIEAYDIYDLTPTQTKLFNMQPYYVFRLESDITYNAGETCPPSNEVETFDVTTSASPTGGGEFNSNPTTLTDLERNTLVSVNATANDNYTFNYLTIGGVKYYNRLQSFYVREDIDLVAYYTSLVIQYYQGVFTGVEDLKTESGLTYIENQGVGSGVDIQIKDVPVGTFDGFGICVDLGDTETLQKFKKTIIFQPHTDNTVAGIWTKSGASVGTREVSLYQVNDKIRFSIGGADGNWAYNGLSSSVDIVANTIYTVVFEYDGSTMTLTVNGTIDTYSITTTMKNTNTNEFIGRDGSGLYFDGFVFSAEKESEGVVNTILPFQENKGVTVYDSSGNGNNGIMSGGLVSDFRGSTSDYSYPALRQYGYEIYEDDTVSGDYLYVVFASGSEQSPTISGYTRLRSVQPYSFDQNPYGHLNEDNAILNTAYDTYAQTQVLKNPNVWTYNDVISISLTGVDPDIFVYTKTGDVVSDMKTAVQ